MKKIRLLGAGLLVLGLLMVAAAFAADGGPQPPHLALVIKTFRNPYFETMVDGAEDGAADLGASIEVAAPDFETSIDQQIAIIDRLVDQKVDGILLAPADSLRVIPALKRAEAAGIPVVDIDNPIDSAAATTAGLKPVPLITVDNEDAAYRAVKAVLRSFGPAKHAIKAAIIEGIRGARNGEARKAGALRAFNEDRRVLLVATEGAEWERDRGEQVAGAIIAHTPDLDLLFCANDNMALGALSALATAGAERVKVVGYDALPEALDAVRAGTLAATVDQRAARQGRMGVEYLLKRLKGETVPPETLVDVRIIRE
ncbi:MAG TPA: substrate-binding domain-containing protein [Aliidongia sp.]|nr:substrate-binding domain-containing protein [Aliidongia sp.]